MSVILVLIITSIVVAVVFLGAFFWAVKSGQYDDTYSPSVRMLFEDKANKVKGDKSSSAKKTE
ncbi:MAG: cbb3-type cytochrome oxidase maturation protein [Roseivirga sp.]|jgi:cbb3-type cytochrome oxidase maturation protein